MLIRKFLLVPLSLFAGSCSYASSYAWSLSADTTRFDYAETGTNGNLLDTETNQFGDIIGFTFALEPLKEGFYLSGSYARGDTDYIGGTNVDPTYGSHLTTTHNRINDYSAGYKMTSVLDPGKLEMPFTLGLGYRGWLRDIQSTPSVSGYEELYEWGYVDIGIGLKTIVTRDTHLGIMANYRNAFNAQMYENWHGYTFELKNVYGYKISVPFEMTLDSSWSALFAYNYEYWNIGASDPIGGYYEPDSETKNQTLSIGIKYRY